MDHGIGGRGEKILFHLAVPNCRPAGVADPSRGESLEGLILDLSRAATEEAQHLARVRVPVEQRFHVTPQRDLVVLGKRDLEAPPRLFFSTWFPSPRNPVVLPDFKVWEPHQPPPVG